MKFSSKFLDFSYGSYTYIHAYKNTLFFTFARNETLKLVNLLSAKKDQNVNLNEIISEFTLNSVCGKK